MEFNQLEQLVAIAKYGTISKAAEVLHLSQPALTRSMQHLEQNLDVKLFNRAKNRVALNENGHLLVEMAQELLDRKTAILAKLKDFDEKNKKIKIVSCAPAPLWGVEALLKTTFPAMKIESELCRDDLSDLDGLDLLISTKPINQNGWMCRELLKERLFLSVPPAHPLALFDEVSFETLNGHSVLLLSKIGIWSALCQKNLPDSRLLFQDDEAIFSELKKMSALPTFRTDITNQRTPDGHNRKILPFTDDEATKTFFLSFRKEERSRFHFLFEAIQTLDWKNT
ncbi:LysR family transcriptional regulator [uncultured Dubosiella sp.]|uniref:LysR family transcriptional regulator n=1 Tax=uncultured Dubosiella sp. TaxID=1937011 RepID=UPI0025B1E019|nr:LysR family transcriptional regulator [uncultured Dubosiella sp.]